MADGFFDKVKRVIGIDDENEYDEYEEELYEQPQQEKPASSVSYSNPGSDFVQPKGDLSGKVLNMQSASANAQAKNQKVKLLIVEPKDFNDCPKLVDSLRSKKPVIINVEKLQPNVARRIFDFLSGAVYATDGRVQKISDSIFVFAPVNIDVMNVSAEKEESSSFENTFMRDTAWNR